MRRTQKYRDLLDKQKKAFQEAFDKIFLSFEMILDNVDQEYNQNKKHKDKQNPPKLDQEL